MYNPGIKEEFLAGYDGGNRKSARPLFEATGVFESACCKDFAEMTFEEAISAIREAKIGSYGTAAAIPGMIKHYVKWCQDSRVFKDVNLDLLKIGVDDIDSSKYLKEMVFISEDELIHHLNSVRPYADGYPEVIVMLFAWAGIKQNDVASIKISDVDIDNRKVYLERRGMYIGFSDKIAEILRVYEKTKVGSRSSGGDNRDVFRDDSHDRFVRKYFPKGKSGDAFTSVQIKHIVNHLNYLYVSQGNHPRFTGSSVLISGALHRVWELEQSGVDVFSIKNKKAVSEAFLVEAKLYEILWLYRNYKKAFNL